MLEALREDATVHFLVTVHFGQIAALSTSTSGSTTYTGVRWICGDGWSSSSLRRWASARNVRRMPWRSPSAACRCMAR